MGTQLVITHEMSPLFQGICTIQSRFISVCRILLWNRNPGCRYPSKANHGARPDCRSLRKIRKRLRTGK
ncbi:uncharacterized protein BBOV_IV006835 [Babesia bovis T2Bo]|uniref:uncharacterized protein n=1 Tax=Babesia bovis T2Bo TaxID=484906 RepID=UPI001DF1502C|nr:uncharacterized protein BBOV_IV006835 [Babesia bovis T2Bo]KAG6439943.1 hypothetical protein BBOV_IV006835 [Babesia bovis T2Bo]